MKKNILRLSVESVITIALCMGVSSLAAEKAELKHRYSFEKTDASETQRLVTDSVGGANGTLFGDASLVQYKDASGQSRGMLSLTGNGDTASITNGSYAALPSDLISQWPSFSVETWVRATKDRGSWMRIFDFGSCYSNAEKLQSGKDYFILTWRSSEGTLCASDKLSGTEYVVNAPMLPVGDGVFHHIVYTYNGEKKLGSIYSDGALVGSAQQPFAPTQYKDGFPNIWLGKSQWPGDAYFAGDYAEFRIYEGVLSPIQISLNTQVGPEKFGELGELSKISATVSQPHIKKGDYLPLTLIGSYSKAGELNILGTATIESSDPSVVREVKPGVLRGLKEGVASVTVQLGDKQSVLKIEVADTTQNRAFYQRYPEGSQEWSPAPWPVLKSYDSDHLYQVALPLGGIGTGTVSLGGRGELRDWEIMNIPGKKFHTTMMGNNAPFFAIYAKPEGEKSSTTMLAGKMYPQEYQTYEGRPVDHHGLPRFSDASFDAAYPFGQVHLSDAGLPLQVTIKGFNPLVPGDADASGLPIAVLSYEVSNPNDVPMEVAVCGSIRNFIGKDGSKFYFDWKGDFIPDGAKDNENVFRKQGGLQGIYFFSNGVATNDTAWGTMALTTQAKEGVTYRTASRQDSWANSILSFWDDFSDDGELVECYSQTENDPMASLSVKKIIPAGEKHSFTFYLTWDFPNRKGWSPTIVGNYYSEQYLDAWEVAERIIPRMGALESDTLGFVNAFLQSTYPDVAKEAALFNLAVLRSQTVFRLPSGHLMGWEGVMDRFGSCEGTCTHVWNYEVATAFLFGDLARTMRDVEFNYSLHENGAMNFRARLPLTTKANSGVAADGQMGCIMKAYREWQLSGDNEFLKSNWEHIKKALAFAWVKRGWDGNQDGVMEGSQHNTMDVNYFGPNPQMGFWYMGALRAAEEMARAMGDTDFQTKCHSLFVQGSQWMDDHLFNGEYYEHKITDPSTFEFLDMSDPSVSIPSFQLGRGCLVDQLVGQYMAHICGLGYLADKEKIQTAIQSVMKYNFIPDFSRLFNNMRSYVIGDEAGLMMASWPYGRLKIPFPYFAESMTGFEYCAAVEMIYEGMESDGLRCIQAIRDRFDGAKRNPFDEPECGHHYARSMASWASLLALSDFLYSGVDGTMNFTSRPGCYFWSNGYAWGSCEVTTETVTLHLMKGSLSLRELTLSGLKEPVGKNIQLKAGEKCSFPRR